jgi:hypothetical protein
MQANRKQRLRQSRRGIVGHITGRSGLCGNIVTVTVI